MSKCIVCECASILTYEPPKERPPLKCPNCGRDTRHYASMKEDDPRVKMLVEKYKARLGDTQPVDGMASSDITQPAADMPSSGRKQQEGKPQYCLVSKDGEMQIKIPDEGGVIGRTAIGGEELAHNGRISREHLRLTPAKRALGVMAEDLSANGTFVDGRKLSKNDREFVVIGSVIKMGGEEFVLERVEQATV